jgi:branched-chain amino acid transport system ATP-binding protein
MSGGIAPDPDLRAAPAPSLLSVTGLHRWFGGLHVIDDVSFSCPAGAVKAIIGPNGAGKTTLFNLIAGALPPAAGSIRLDGESITGLPPHRIAERGVARTFQSTRLFPGMSVLENVMVGAHVRTRAGFLACLAGPLATGTEERRARRECHDVLAGLGAADLAGRDASTLPFGRQRIVEIARALAARPRLLLLDEPACGLNPAETEALAEIILSIRRAGVTILIVEHDMSLVMGISDEVIALSEGRTIAEGTPRAVQADPRVAAVYLGDNGAPRP